jgi:quercetin dioxygenase-like cupin family protein
VPFVSPADAPNARVARVPIDAAAAAEFARTPLIGSPSVRLVLIEMPAGFGTMAHRHPAATESFFILSGSGRFVIGDSGPIAVVAGDLLHAEVDEVHAIEAGADGLRFIACVGPNEDRPDEEVAVPDGHEAG